MGILSELNNAAKSGDIAAMDSIVARCTESNNAAVVEMRKFNDEYTSAMQQRLNELAAMAARLRK